MYETEWYVENENTQHKSKKFESKMYIANLQERNGVSISISAVWTDHSGWKVDTHMPTAATMENEKP